MSDTLRKALREGLLTLDDTADTNRIWRAMDYTQLSDLLVATPTGKALADVVEAACRRRDEYGIRGTPVPSQSREGELARAIDRLREATR